MQMVRPSQLIWSTFLPGLPEPQWADTGNSHALKVRHWDPVSCMSLSVIQNMLSGPLSPTLTDASAASEADNVGHSHIHGAKRKTDDGYDPCGDMEVRIVRKVELEVVTMFHVLHAHIITII